MEIELSNFIEDLKSVSFKFSDYFDESLSHYSPNSMRLTANPSSSKENHIGVYAIWISKNSNIFKKCIQQVFYFDYSISPIKNHKEKILLEE